MRLTRRQFLTASAACAASPWLPRLALAATGQIWGAIRWDAWWGTSRDALDAERDLWPSKWQFRAPAWAKKTDDPEKLEFAPTQDDMDREISAAHAAGLKYWAYCYYPKGDHEFMKALQFHRASKHREAVNFCVVTNLLHWVDDDGFKSYNRSLVDLATDKIYQKAHGRPLIYLFWDAGAFERSFGSQNRNVAARLADLRDQMLAAGLGAPYLALMKYTDAKTLAEIGADALASYAVGPADSETPVSFSTFDLNVRNRWRAQLQTGAQVIPTAMTGWDMRPLVDDTPGFYKNNLPKHAASGYVVNPTPEELGRHVRAGVDFIRDHPSQCREKLGLIYSWNECIEGGNVLAPTLGDPQGRLLMNVGAIVQ